MEFLMILSITLLVSTFFTYLLFNNKPKNLPPGKMGWPYIGESLEFVNSGLKGEPEKFIFDRIAKFSSQVFKTSVLLQPTVVVCGPAANKFLFSNENKLVNVWFPDAVKKILPTTAQTSTYVEAKRLRMMLPNFLKPEALLTYISMMDSIAQKHFVSGWEGKKEVTVFPLTKRYTFLVACKVFLSIDDPEHVATFADPFDVLAAGLNTIPVDLPGTPFRRSIKAANELRKRLVHIIKQRKIELEENKASPTQDVLSHMLSVTDENGQPMTEIYIADKIIALLIAGHDTASAVLTCILKFLSQLPHIYSEVLKEQMEIAESKKPGELLNWDDLQKMKYTWNVANEAMRLAPPSRGTFREAITNFNFSGFSIPKGWKLLWSSHSTHWNSEYFPDPQKFDPTRFEGKGPAPYTFVPFGGGPRMCPGKEYARLEILVFLHHVIKRFSWEQLIHDEKIIVNPMSVPEKGFPARLIPHKA
ncbi:hypothetical protein LWI28_027482 [Acer negundo]|uniref:Cytochrome P450 n=1 Tax=Acer negundo TaxID=4023 RepID=A0AAD5P3A8_ACENE|nr:hypothetical protein LWI28_027482 [Acer negundo]